MIELLEGKDPRTRNHSLRVAALAAATARRLELDPRAAQDLVWGRCSTTSASSACPKRCSCARTAERSAEERARSTGAIRSSAAHPRRRSPRCRRAAEIVAAHHERRDGAGYPPRLTSDRLPLGAEIVAAANRLDHLRQEAPDAPESLGRRELRAEAARGGAFRSDYVEAVLHAAREFAPEPPLARDPAAGARPRAGRHDPGRRRQRHQPRALPRAARRAPATR